MPVVTTVFLAVILAGFALDFLILPPKGVKRFGLKHIFVGYGRGGHALGAAANALCLRTSAVKRGQAWRIITSNFIHGGLWHLVPNCVCIWIAGSIAEREIGSWKLLLVLVVCGAFSNFCVMHVLQHETGYGASVSLYGVFAVLVVLCLRQKGYLLAATNWPERLILLAYLLSNIVAAPAIWVVHGGSFICGVALSYFLV
ncbi:MAG: rhomboid family intramembrane serine protease [Oscillospiraceae bacterium]|jgi:rhomboid protease GluP|nr:rhomboid family intramembrane serine protease [Oscillospiraceae bacterium]